MNLFRLDPSSRGHGPDMSSLDRLVQEALDRLRIWQRRQQERRELVKLTDFEIRDLGMSRSDVVAEANKPFWRN